MKPDYDHDHARGWVFMRVGPDGASYVFECERCGREIGVLLPVSIDDMLDVSKAFGNRHGRCEPSLRGERRQLLAVLRRRANPAGGSFTISLGVG